MVILADLSSAPEVYISFPEPQNTVHVPCQAMSVSHNLTYTLLLSNIDTEENMLATQSSQLECPTPRLMHAQTASSNTASILKTLRPRIATHPRHPRNEPDYGP